MVWSYLSENVAFMNVTGKKTKYLCPIKHHTTNSCRNGGIALRILNLLNFSTEWKDVVNFAYRPHYPHETALYTNSVAGIVCPRFGLHSAEKRNESLPKWGIKIHVVPYVCTLAEIYLPPAKTMICQSSFVVSVYFLCFKTIQNIQIHKNVFPVIYPNWFGHTCYWFIFRLRYVNNICNFCIKYFK
jgi:hypothetical protein